MTLKTPVSIRKTTSIDQSITKSYIKKGETPILTETTLTAL